jgi:hypothetical protein
VPALSLLGREIDANYTPVQLEDTFAAEDEKALAGV